MVTMFEHRSSVSGKTLANKQKKGCFLVCENGHMLGPNSLANGVYHTHLLYESMLDVW